MPRPSSAGGTKVWVMTITPSTRRYSAMHCWPSTTASKRVGSVWCVTWIVIGALSRKPIPLAFLAVQPLGRDLHRLLAIAYPHMPVLHGNLQLHRALRQRGQCLALLGG